MIVDVDQRGARLLDAVNFRALIIRSTLDAHATAEALGSLLSQDGNHVWIARNWFLSQNVATDQAWRDQFDAMMAYAVDRGWTNGAGAIRAHIDLGSVSASGPTSGVGVSDDFHPDHSPHR